MTVAIRFVTAHPHELAVSNHTPRHRLRGFKSCADRDFFTTLACARHVTGMARGFQREKPCTRTSRFGQILSAIAKFPVSSTQRRLESDPTPGMDKGCFRPTTLTSVVEEHLHVQETLTPFSSASCLGPEPWQILDRPRQQSSALRH